MSADSVSMGDRNTESLRSPIRFMVFGLIVALLATVLGARLFMLQVANTGQFANLAAANRSVAEAILSTRGVVYDRNGLALVTNVPSYTVKLRPADLPEERRADVVQRLAALLRMDPADINIAIDSNPGSRFDLVRIATDVDENVANFIAESRLDLPGTQIVVESRREYTTGALLSQVMGYTGPINRAELDALGPDGYLPDDRIGKTGVESEYESALRGVYGSQLVEKDASGRKLQVLQTVRDAVPGESLDLTIDVKEQQFAEKALKWGMATAKLKRGVIIVMNPQTGEILAMVSLPTYDDNLFAHGISSADYAALLANPDKPLINHAIAEHFPPGSTYKLVTGTGALADRKITTTSKVLTKGFLTLGTTKFWEWNHRGWGALDIRSGFAHSSDTFFYQLAGMLGIDRLAYWAHEYGFGAATGIDLPGEASGIVPSNQWKLDTFGTDIYPGEVYQAGIGQGYDVATPLQLLNAYAALANGGTLYQPQIVRDIKDVNGNIVRPFTPEVIHKLDVKASVLETMRQAARQVVTSRHTYNLTNLPIVVAGKTGTAEYGTKDAAGRLPFHSWFVAFVPKDAAVSSKDPEGMKAVSRTDSELAVVAFAYDSGTVGNVATEVVKYYLQLHYGIKKDYRLFDLIKRGSQYFSN